MAVEKSVVDKQIEDIGNLNTCFKRITKKEQDYLHEILSPGEIIHATTSGIRNWSVNIWFITVTDKRIIFLSKGMFYGLKQLDILLRNISSISCKKGLLFWEIKVITFGNRVRIEGICICNQDVGKVANIISDLARKAQEQKENTISY